MAYNKRGGKAGLGPGHGKQMLKRTVESWIEAAVDALSREHGNEPLPVQVERPAESAHGDYASNAALVLASKLKRKPRELAEELKQRLPGHGALERVAVAGPGFLNFYLRTDALRTEALRALREGRDYGRAQFGAGQRALVEFVSANPTGPLHVGHGRGAAYGDVLARLLGACGYRVEREYYINDCGRQAETLGLSVLLRRLTQTARTVPNFPQSAYQGAYINELAERLPPALDAPLGNLGTWPDPPPDADAEVCLDKYIAHAKQRLGEDYERLCSFAMDQILEGIRADLEHIGIVFDHWVRESQLRRDGQVTQVIEALERAGHLYYKDGATWFRASALGDEKDRVLVRENGEPTYFAADVAYHADKYRRGYDLIVNVWGADHHGYTERLRAALRALGLDDTRLEILLVQFVALSRGKERVAMSTRQGQYVCLDELYREVGTAPTRYTYILRNSGQHLDFDLKLASSASNENPVYYVQYAHARICSILRKAKDVPATDALTALGTQDVPEERQLMAELAAYPETVEASARQREPHLLAYYLQTLAGRFHVYYNHCHVLANDPQVRTARLGLVQAVRQVISNGLELIGIEAPEHM